ncbi:hypothetical protein ABIA48_004885 [Pseudomonas sp. S30_BP2TU TE3576]
MQGQSARTVASLDVDLVGAVMNNATETFTGFLDTYERDVLPPRELAKGTLGLYAVHFRRFRKQFEGKAVDQVTIRMIAEMLDALTPRTANQCRALLIDIFNHAAAKGLCPDNPAASTINRIEKKQRRRHTVEGLKAIREKAPAWLQNAIDLALITAQRRTDILDMRFDGVREGFLYVVQKKTAKAREAANCYAGWKEEEMPGFHEVRALSLHLHKKAGKDGQKIAGPASEGMTKNYQRDHEEVIWSEAIPDLNISEITG